MQTGCSRAPWKATTNHRHFIAERACLQTQQHHISCGKCSPGLLQPPAATCTRPGAAASAHVLPAHAPHMPPLQPAAATAAGFTAAYTTLHAASSTRDAIACEHSSNLAPPAHQYAWTKSAASRYARPTPAVLPPAESAAAATLPREQLPLPGQPLWLHTAEQAPGQPCLQEPDQSRHEHTQQQANNGSN